MLRREIAYNMCQIDGADTLWERSLLNKPQRHLSYHVSSGGFESDIMKRRLAPSTSPNHIQSNDLIQAASENATDCSNFKAIEFECILDVRRNVVNISIASAFFANQVMSLML